MFKYLGRSNYLGKNVHCEQPNYSLIKNMTSTNSLTGLTIQSLYVESRKIHLIKQFIRHYDNTSLSCIFDPTIIVKPEECHKPWSPLAEVTWPLPNSQRKIFYGSFDFINDDYLASNNTNESSNNTNESSNKNSIVNSKFQNVLIWAAGGPASGKTTLLHNMATLMKDNYGQNMDQMLIVGNTLMKSLNLSSKPIIQTLINRAPIIIDGHGVDENDISNVINFAKKNNYRTILIYPWVNFNAFYERLNKQMEEIGCYFFMSSFWQNHQIIHKKMLQYIKSPDTCPFDVCLIFDNNHDRIKPMIWSKIMDRNYLVDDHILVKINRQLKASSIDNTAINTIKFKPNYKFIPNKEYFSTELKEMFNCLFEDLALDNNNYVRLNSHFRTLVLDNWHHYKIEESS
jgi:hypothetical protein